jgi:hypothetical protein
MLRKISGGWSLVSGLVSWAVLCVVLAATAVAGDEAAKIRDGIDRYLQSAGNAAFHLSYELEVAAAGDGYETSIHGLTVRYPGPADQTSIGDVSFRVTPLDDGNYRFSQVRIPEEIRFASPEQAGEDVVLHLNLERFEGVYSPETGTTIEYDILVKDVSLEASFASAKTGMFQSTGIAIGAFSHSLQSRPQSEKAMEQVLNYGFTDISVSHCGETLFRIGSSSLQADWLLSDYAASVARNNKFFAELMAIEKFDEQSFIQLLRYSVVTPEEFSYLRGDMTFEEISWSRPETLFTLDQLKWTMDADDLDKPVGTNSQVISARGFSLSAPQDPVKDATFSLFPRRWTLPIKLKNLPSAAIVQEYARLFRQSNLLSDLVAGMGPSGDLDARLTQHMVDAGTVLVLDGQSIESEIVSATMDGSLKFDSSSPLQMTGSVSAEVVGLMQLFEQAQTLQDREAAEEVMQGTMMLLSMGETEPGMQVPSVTKYLIEMTPEGAVVLNGTQLSPPPAPEL